MPESLSVLSAAFSPEKMTFPQQELSSVRKSNLSIVALLAEIAHDSNLKQIRDKMIHDKDIQQEAGGYRR